jgi:hypothetical protein
VQLGGGSTPVAQLVSFLRQLCFPLPALGCAAWDCPLDLRLCVGRGARGGRRLLDSLGWRFVGLLASRRDQDDAKQDNERNQSNARPDPQSIGRTKWDPARALLWRRRRLRGAFTNWHEHSLPDSDDDLLPNAGRCRQFLEPKAGSILVTLVLSVGQACGQAGRPRAGASRSELAVRKRTKRCLRLHVLCK